MKDASAKVMIRIDVNTYILTFHRLDLGYLTFLISHFGLGRLRMTRLDEHGRLRFEQFTKSSKAACKNIIMLPLGHIALNFIVISPFKRINTQRIFIYLLIGSLLPDLIDKPLGFIIFHGFGNGRLIAHSLLFNVALLMLLRGDRMIIPIASILHLIEDRMWDEPEILFYPFLGNFPEKPVISWEERVRRILEAYRNPEVLLFDILGLILLLILTARQHKKFKS